MAALRVYSPALCRLSLGKTSSTRTKLRQCACEGIGLVSEAHGKPRSLGTVDRAMWSEVNKESTRLAERDGRQATQAAIRS
jgi:hypothetical protein